MQYKMKKVPLMVFELEDGKVYRDIQDGDVVLVGHNPYLPSQKYLFNTSNNEVVLAELIEPTLFEELRTVIV